MFKFELFLDGLFITDIFLNFISAYEGDNTVFIEVRFKTIALSYIKSWFLLDVLCSIPFQLIDGGGDGTSKSKTKLLKLARLPRLYRLLRILRIFKMLRLFRLSRTFKQYFETVKMNAGVTRMISVIITVLLMVHLMSCFWFLSAEFNSFPYDSWVAIRGIIDESSEY
jgi:hypothetical protein